MKWILLLSLALVSCQFNGYYPAGSVAEVKALGKRAVETGVMFKGEEAAFVARKSVGKPPVGKWDPQKIERFLAKFAEKNPRVVQINLAANKGVISERDRLILISQVEAAQAAEANLRAARSRQVAASLNNFSANLNRGTANINQSTALINQSTVNSLNSRSYNSLPYAPTFSPIYRPTTTYY